MKRQTVYLDPAVRAERFASPTGHDLHVDTAMSNISIAYRNSTYIADQVFPVVNVRKQSDKYYVF